MSWIFRKYIWMDDVDISTIKCFTTFHAYDGRRVINSNTYVIDRLYKTHSPSECLLALGWIRFPGIICWLFQFISKWQKCSANDNWWAKRYCYLARAKKLSLNINKTHCMLFSNQIVRGIIIMCLGLNQDVSQSTCGTMVLLFGTLYCPVVSLLMPVMQFPPKPEMCYDWRYSVKNHFPGINELVT